MRYDQIVTMIQQNTSQLNFPISQRRFQRSFIEPWIGFNRSHHTNALFSIETRNLFTPKKKTKTEAQSRRQSNTLSFTQAMPRSCCIVMFANGIGSIKCAMCMHRGHLPNLINTLTFFSAFVVHLKFYTFPSCYTLHLNPLIIIIFGKTS